MRGAFVAFLGALAACAASPDRVPVELDFEVPGEWVSGDPDAGAVGVEWWKSFGDPGLVAAVEEALSYNYDLRIAAARVLEAQARAQIAGAEVYPWVDLGAGAQRLRQNFIGLPIAGTGVPSRTFNTFGVSLNLSWELDVWGRIRAGQSAAIADVEAAAAEHYAAQLSLIAQTAKAWYAVAEARRQVALAEETVVSFRATSEQVRDRFESGVRPPLDLRLALTNLAGAEAAVSLRRELLDRAVRQLELLMGQYPDGGTEGSDVLPGEFAAVPSGLPSELLLRRPDLVAAERRLAAADQRLESAKAALYPRFSLTASGGTASADLEDVADTDFRVWTLAANMLAPLFQGGALRGEVSRNEAVTLEAVAAYAADVQQAFGEVETALAVEVSLAQRVVHLQEAAVQSLAARQLSEDRYLTGLEEFLTVADTQRTALNAESALLDAQRQRLDARIDLFLALGGGFPASEVLEDER